MAQAPVIERKCTHDQLKVRETQWSYKILIHEVAYQVTGLTVKYLPFKGTAHCKTAPGRISVELLHVRIRQCLPELNISLTVNDIDQNDHLYMSICWRVAQSQHVIFKGL